MKKIFTNLTFWVLTAITCGILLGNFYPATAVKMKVFGDYFILVIKCFIYPIIFLTISLGISNMGDLKKVGRVGGKAILYFEIVTTMALLIGILVAHLIQPGSGVNTNNIKGNDVSGYITQAEEFSWWRFLKANFTLQVLLLAIIAGIWLSKYEKKERIIRPLSLISKYVLKRCIL
jgi:aerobic C4-dicarboxylate transport protein